MVAGEVSGDLYGGMLAAAIKAIAPQVVCYGVGGKEMERQGVKIIYSSAELAVVGATEVLSKIRHIIKAWDLVKRFIEQQRPDLAILIDYPGFNLRLAKFCRDHGVPVLYYVSPQVWAWRSGRINKIAKRVTKMAVILPFEAPLYKAAGVDVSYVGHPLLDILDMNLSREEARRRLGLPQEALLIPILPGSREREVRSLLPPLLGAARILSSEFPASRFIIPIAPTIERSMVAAMVEGANLPIELLVGRAFEVMKGADLVLLASGTATLEAAIAGVPMVIVYRVSPITYIIGRLVVKVECIGLANIIIGKRVVPELIQGEVTAERIASEARNILQDRNRQRDIRDTFMGVLDRLGGRGASARVAKIALEMMEGR